MSERPAKYPFAFLPAFIALFVNSPALLESSPDTDRILASTRMNIALPAQAQDLLGSVRLPNGRYKGSLQTVRKNQQLSAYYVTLYAKNGALNYHISTNQGSIAEVLCAGEVFFFDRTSGRLYKPAYAETFRATSITFGELCNRSFRPDYVAWKAYTIKTSKSSLLRLDAEMPKKPGGASLFFGENNRLHSIDYIDTEGLVFRSAYFFWPGENSATLRIEAMDLISKSITNLVLADYMASYAENVSFDPEGFIRNDFK